MTFIQRALCESDGTPSSTRINLLILLVFTLNLIAAAFWCAGKLPEVPESLANLIKFLFGAATTKVSIGAIADIGKAFAGRSEAKNGAE